MFKIPVCPYCNTVYHYGEVNKTKYNKTQKCYHCKKDFKIKRMPGLFVLWLIVATAAVLINIVILQIMPVFNVIPLVVISVVAILIGLIFIPFFISYKK